MDVPVSGPRAPHPTHTDGWAAPERELHPPRSFDGLDPINIEGRRAVGPSAGFGQMWEKTYTFAFAPGGPPPELVIARWKERFGDLWPAKNEFKARSRMAAGDVGVAKLALPGGFELRTGMFVLSSSERSFTLLTPQGHMYAGWITFSAEREQGRTVARVQTVLRSGDPLYELGMLLGAHGREDQFWKTTLQNLGLEFGESHPVRLWRVRLDRRRQWRKLTNTWYNAAVRTQLHRLASPLRWLRRRGTRRHTPKHA